MPALRFLVPAIALGLAALATANASAQTVINSVPYVINTSGQYVLGSNLIVSAANLRAITINAPNVILDLNEFFVSGPGGTPASDQAVITVGNFSNVTIRNGTVANNGYGILFNGSLPNSINHVVEKVNFTRCYLAGIWFNGSSAATIVRNNTLSQIGNSTFSANVSASAIRTLGGVSVETNLINQVTATGAGTATGIAALAGSSGDLVVGNRIIGATVGVLNAARYKDNLTLGCTTPFSGGTDAGGNF